MTFLKILGIASFGFFAILCMLMVVYMAYLAIKLPLKHKMWVLEWYHVLYVLITPVVFYSAFTMLFPHDGILWYFGLVSVIVFAVLFNDAMFEKIWKGAIAEADS